MFFLSCVYFAFVRVCLFVPSGHLLCHFPVGILGQVWYLIVSIPDLCNLTFFKFCQMMSSDILLDLYSHFIPISN